MDGFCLYGIWVVHMDGFNSGCDGWCLLLMGWQYFCSLVLLKVACASTQLQACVSMKHLAINVVFLESHWCGYILADVSIGVQFPAYVPKSLKVAYNKRAATNLAFLYLGVFLGSRGSSVSV